ncbi:MAG: cobalamin biosynthesis protein CobW [Alphaproteobacteria bacterium]|nr:cobalamin biosynthesis protein CobW [Alphaproteobacteria bacterium]
MIHGVIHTVDNRIVRSRRGHIETGVTQNLNRIVRSAGAQEVQICFTGLTIAGFQLVDEIGRACNRCRVLVDIEVEIEVRDIGPLDHLSFGDPRQELVFIGSDIDWPALKAKLDAALLPEVQAYSPDQIPNMPDPFPHWQRTEAAE